MKTKMKNPQKTQKPLILPTLNAAKKTKQNITKPNKPQISIQHI